MSHFTCFTVGDVDSIMEKCNEQDEKFFKPVEDKDIDWYLNFFKNLDEDSETKTLFYEKYPLQEDRESFVKFFGWFEKSTPVYKEEDLDAFFKEKKKVFLVKNGEVKKAYYYHNPDTKYDYYCIIGEDSFARWQSLSFIMKDGARANTGFIKDLNIDATVKECVEKDREEYRKVFSALGRLNHKPWKYFLEMEERKEITLEQAREMYNSQEDVERFKKWSRDNDLWLDADNYLCTEEEFVENTTFPIFCANILGEWFEKGEMGWWAVVHDEKEPATWKKLIEEKLHEVQETHPNEVFHVLDCHI